MRLIRLLLFSASTCLFALSAHAERLLEVYQIALDSDPVLKQYIAKQEAVKEQTRQSLAAFLPFVSASATGSRIRSTGYSYSSDQSYNNNGYDINLKQSIYDNKNYVTRRISRLNLSATSEELKQAQQNLISRVVNAYLDVLLAKDTVEFSKAEQKAIAQQLEQAKQRYEVGIIAITAKLNAQAGYDSATAAVLKAENDYQLARERLRDIAGKYFDQLNTLKEDIPLKIPKPDNIEAWVKTAMDNNPALKSLQFKKNASRENIELQRSGHYPSFGAFASYNYTDRSSSSTFLARDGSDATIGIEMKLPIYQGGLISSKTREAEYNYRELMNKEEEIRRTTERQARNSYLSVLSEISRVKALKQAVISNESALKATQAGYEVGTRTIVDILNVQRDRFDARRNYSQARYNFIRNIVFLKQSAGILSEQDLKEIDTWFH